MSRLAAFILGLLGLALANYAWAEPFVEHVEPPSVCRGQKNQLTIVGQDVDRAMGIWTSLPADKFKVAAVSASEKERSQFQIEVAADCPLGIYGLRIATEDGLSNLHLFVVDDLLPRSSLNDPQIEMPVAIAGELRPAAVDRHRIQVSSGQKVSFDVIASRLGNDADPLVTIYDSTGKRIAQRDNDPGLSFDCSWEQTFEQTGIYTVEVRDSRFLGSPHWRYLLRMGNFPAAHVAIPSAVRPGEMALLHFPELAGIQIPFDVPATQKLGGLFHTVRRPGDGASSWVPLLSSPLPSTVETEPNDTLEQATPTSQVPVILHGYFEQPGDKDYFQLVLKKGDRLSVRAETKAINSPADVELSIVDATGREIQRVDDVNLPGGALDEGSLTFGVGQDGNYFVLVRELTKASGPEYSYRVTVRPVAPKFELVAEASAFTIPQNGYQSLPITVTRSEYTGPIELSLVGAPAGFKLEPSVIPESENGVLCKLSATGELPLGLYQLELSGKGRAGEAVITSAVATHPLVDRQLVNVDLIKHALRDNQRWLPPSVTDKLAVQITPPTPFNVDLASSSVTLPRYQQVDVPLHISRSAGFEGEISFLATGTQQLGQESQGRRQVFARFATATSDMPAVTGTIHSRSQANEGTERVDIRATARQGTRSIQLERSVMLAIKPAFEVEVEPAKVALAPGGAATVKFRAIRLPSFAGEVTITPMTPLGVALPESIVIPADKSSVEIEIKVEATLKPGNQRIRFVATAPVNGFQEEPRAKDLEIEIKEPTPAAATK